MITEDLATYCTYLETPLGSAEVIVSDRGLRSLQFGSLGSKKDKHPLLDEVSLQLNQYFEKQRTRFDLELDLQGTDFQKKVWKELVRIPFGTTVSYQKIANRIEKPGAVRAVGNANGRNKVAVVIPCHRVIGEDGSLTGYTGGLDRKRWLLNFEQALMQPKLF